MRMGMVVACKSVSEVQQPASLAGASFATQLSSAPAGGIFAPTERR
jgi:hypothetical protein